MEKSKKPGRKMISEAVYLEYLSNLLAGNKKECTSIVQTLLAQKVEAKSIFINLFQRSMYRIGKLWEKDKCSVADEHVATKITEGLVELTIAELAGVKNRKKSSIVTCVDKEFHELGARMVAGLFELNGWKTFFVGSNTPNSEILHLISDKKPEVVGISCSFYVNIVRVVKLVKMIKENYPDQRIIVGGQAFSSDLTDDILRYKKVNYIESLDALQKYITKYK